MQAPLPARPLWSLVLALALTTALPVRAEEAVEDDPGEPADEPLDPDRVAVRANDVNQEFCAEIYSTDIQLQVQGYKEVATAWEEVDRAYGETGETTLLYWRGVLAHCLSQRDQALADFRLFLDVHSRDPKVETMAQDARKRVKRIEGVQAAQSQVGRRRHTALTEDPQAASLLGRVEYRRYLRAGLPLDQWLERRDSLRGRVVLWFAVSPSYGPYTAVHQVLSKTNEYGEPIDEYYLEAALLHGWQFRIDIGLELWFSAVLAFGFALDFAPSNTEAFAATSADFPRFEGTVDRVEDVRAGGGVQAWFATTILPRKPVKPLFRVGARFRQMPGPKLDTYVLSDFDWSVFSVGAYAGVAVESRAAIGFDVGCWVMSDLTRNHRVEAAPADLSGGDLDKFALEGRMMSLSPFFALRIIL